MKQRDLIRRIRKELKINTLTELANALGYRSPSTIHSWLKNGKIPALAKDKVERFFGIKK